MHRLETQWESNADYFVNNLDTLDNEQQQQPGARCYTTTGMSKDQQEQDCIVTSLMDSSRHMYTHAKSITPPSSLLSIQLRSCANTPSSSPPTVQASPYLHQRANMQTGEINLLHPSRSTSTTLSTDEDESAVSSDSLGSQAQTRTIGCGVESQPIAIPSSTYLLDPRQIEERKRLHFYRVRYRQQLEGL